MNVIDMEDSVFLSNPETDTQGYCMHDDRICVITFRGTQSLNDWITNLKFVLVWLIISMKNLIVNPLKLDTW